jgi:hypothetical protein
MHNVRLLPRRKFLKSVKTLNETRMNLVPKLKEKRDKELLTHQCVQQKEHKRFRDIFECSIKDGSS